MGYKIRSVTLIDQEVLINGWYCVHERTLLGVTNEEGFSRIKQRFETRREGRGGGRAIAICGSLAAHFNFENRC